MVQNRFLTLITFSLTTAFVSAQAIDINDVDESNFSGSMEKPSLRETRRAYNSYKSELSGAELSEEQVSLKNSIDEALDALDNSLPEDLSVPGNYSLAPVYPSSIPFFKEDGEYSAEKKANLEERIEDSAEGFSNEVFDSIEDYYLYQHYEGDEYLSVFDSYEIEITDEIAENGLLEDGEYEATWEIKKWWWNRVVNSDGETVAYAAFPVFEFSGYPVYGYDAEITTDGNGLPVIARQSIDWSPGGVLVSLDGSDFTSGAEAYLRAKKLQGVQYPN